jgi:hypothetical protein
LRNGRSREVRSTRRKKSFAKRIREPSETAACPIFRGAKSSTNTNMRSNSPASFPTSRKPMNLRQPRKTCYPMTRERNPRDD